MTDVPEDIFATARTLADDAVTFGYTLAALDIAKALLAERERDHWQPIETAPKDGTVVDLWATRETTGDRSRYTDCAWRQPFFGSEPYGAKRWVGLDERYSVITPTHWRPLPKPPSSATPTPELTVRAEQ